MKRIFLTIISFAAILSCTPADVKQTLDDVDCYIMERPDSALGVLEAMDRGLLRTESARAHHALLHAMALDKNYIDVTDDSIAQVAVDYYSRKGPQKSRARAYYYLGLAYYYQQEYDKAILEFTKAEEVAKECDSLYLGMIYSVQADIYSCTYNSTAELSSAQKAYDIFTSIDANKYIRGSLYGLAVAYHNIDDYAKALEVYRDIIEGSESIDYYHVQSVLAMPHSMIEMPEVDYAEIESLFRKSKYEYGADLAEKDYWAWAYSLYRLGRDSEAEQMIETMEVTDELIAGFWKSRIAEWKGDFKTAYEYDCQTADRQNDIIESVLEESLASYQRDYYQARSESSEYRMRMRTVMMSCMVLIALLMIVILLSAISRYVRRQEEEKEKYLQYIDEIKRQLSAVDNDGYSKLKKKYLSLYKSRFEAVGMLSEQYIQAQGRTDIESLIFRKVMKLIDEIRNDSANRAAFEAMLDNDLDNIMTNLRSEMPKLRETDFAIFSYLVVGFDATTISRLLDVSVNIIYIRKSRIKAAIESSSAEHRNQFLEILS